jgi:hypothetical protein
MQCFAVAYYKIRAMLHPHEVQKLVVFRLLCPEYILFEEYIYSALPQVPYA